MPDQTGPRSGYGESVISDDDGFGIVAEVLTKVSAHPLTRWIDCHHVLGRNLGFALFVSIAAALVAKSRIKTALLVAVSFHLHLIADLVGARGPDGDQWPIPYLLPFSRSGQLTWSGQWALNAWPNLLITAVLIGIAAFCARRRGFSPLGMFSNRADAAFVQALRNRFPVKPVIKS